MCLLGVATGDQKSFKWYHCAHSEEIIKPIERDRKIISADRMGVQEVVAVMALMLILHGFARGSQIPYCMPLVTGFATQYVNRI